MFIIDPGPSTEELFEQTLKMFNGDRAVAEKWFNEPKKALGGVSLRDKAQTPNGSIRVESFIGQLEYGEII
ncbi:MbcA/ParS/Xre antitoxin family protein [bacterium]|nr:MbcA/ParS/Xre antitoxin family protein [bacterium]